MPPGRPPPPMGPPGNLELVPDRRSRYKSKYTADRNIPGAFEGETITRRRFMTGSANAAGAP